MLSKKFILVGLLLLMGILGVIGMRMYTSTATDLTSAKADYKIDAVELFNQFEEKEEWANSQYLNKIIEVSGTLDKLNKMSDGSYQILLGAGNSMGMIQCALDDRIEHGNLENQKGKRITIRGNCSGKLIDIVMIRCVVLNK